MVASNKVCATLSFFHAADAMKTAMVGLHNNRSAFGGDARTVRAERHVPHFRQITGDTSKHLSDVAIRRKIMEQGDDSDLWNSSQAMEAAYLAHVMELSATEVQQAVGGYDGQHIPFDEEQYELLPVPANGSCFFGSLFRFFKPHLEEWKKEWKNGDAEARSTLEARIKQFRHEIAVDVEKNWDELLPVGLKVSDVLSSKEVSPGQTLDTTTTFEYLQDMQTTSEAGEPDAIVAAFVLQAKIVVHQGSVSKADFENDRNMEDRIYVPEGEPKFEIHLYRSELKGENQQGGHFHFDLLNPKQPAMVLQQPARAQSTAAVSNPDSMTEHEQQQLELAIQMSMKQESEAGTPAEDQHEQAVGELTHEQSQQSNTTAAVSNLDSMTEDQELELAMQMSMEQKPEMQHPAFLTDCVEMIINFDRAICTSNKKIGGQAKRLEIVLNNVDHMASETPEKREVLFTMALDLLELPLTYNGKNGELQIGAEDKENLVQALRKNKELMTENVRAKFQAFLKKH